eukprot:g6719.t1
MSRRRRLRSVRVARRVAKAAVTTSALLCVGGGGGLSVEAFSFSATPTTAAGRRCGASCSSTAPAGRQQPHRPGISGASPLWPSRHGGFGGAVVGDTTFASRTRGWGGGGRMGRAASRRGRPCTPPALSMAAEVLSALGKDALMFLAATVAVVPACKKLNISPVLGFLATGAVLGPAGFSVIKDLNELDTLGELGISFLLFEQGLELSLDRLKALSKYAFGLGTAQVLLCTLAFAAFPFLGGVDLLEIIFHSPAELVSIRRVDEAVVIGAALSLSSSAFVLKILQEKGQKAERFGRAVLGILLLQDIAVVPLLVLLPIIETQGGANTALSQQLLLVGATVAKGVGGLGGILVAGRFLLRPLFDVVAGARSSETFVALCLLVALGMGQLTEAIGLSSTLGAFAAGTLLAETNYRTQVEANIAPFRGLLLGLFFTTTGATVDPMLLMQQWPTVFALLLGLVSFKTIIISSASLGFGLTAPEAAKTGLILSGGGEFAFVVLSLSQRLGVLPEELNRLLIGVVVLSMALTPALSELGDFASEKLIEVATKKGMASAVKGLELRQQPEEGEGKGLGGQEKVVICGFGPVGQIVGSLLSAPVIKDKLAADYVAFDLNPTRVRQSKAQGFPVFYGDGTEPEVLKTAGMEDPKALVVTYSNQEVSRQAVERLHLAFPRTPIFARATDYEQYLALQDFGATAVVSDLSEISIRLGSELLESFGVARSDDVQSAKTDLRKTLVELARRGDIKGDFSARFTPAMLSVKRDSALKAAGAPPPGQPFPKESKKLGVEVCLLPSTDTREWQEESPHPCDSQDLGEEKDDAGDGGDVAAVVEDALSGAVLNGGGGGSVAGEAGEAGLQREGSDWEVAPGAGGAARGKAGEGGAGLKQGGSDRVVVAVAPGDGGDAAAAAASSEQP